MSFNQPNGEPQKNPSVVTHVPETNGRSTLFPKILKIGDVLFQLRKIPEYKSPSTIVPLIGTTKLHGTHADLVFESASSSGFRLQSRQRHDLKVGNEDNAGFAAWIAEFGTNPDVIYEVRDKFVKRYQELNPGQTVRGEMIIAAEWCGTGIQKQVAIVKVPRFLAIISVFINGTWVPDWEYTDIDDPKHRIFNVGRAGYYRHNLELDDEGLADSQAEIAKMTKEVEVECPFAKNVFGISGIGEGIVWKVEKLHGDDKFWFKSKGELHEVSKVHKLSASAVDVINNERVANFANAVVTENRLEQGWDLLDQKNATGLGPFLRWVVADCMVEEKREMDNLKIPKYQLKPAIVAIAKPWYLNKAAL